jgi:diguanylate cyclase (GGDEF)-like protein/PAS domain S-box-containing protein
LKPQRDAGLCRDPAHEPGEIQRRLDDLLDHLPAGVVVHDVNGRILSANALAERLLGHSEAELCGIKAIESVWTVLYADGSVMPPADYPVNRVLRTREPVSDQVIGVAELGSDALRWMICNAYPEIDTAGNLRGATVCFTDCTELKRAQQSLHKSEERLRLALLGSTDAPWDWNLMTGEVYYSDRWWEMLAYAPGECAADTEAWRRHMHPDDRPRVDAFVAGLLRGQQQTYNIEFRLRHRDGHYVPVLARGFVLRDASGRALRISGVNTDLTERKRAEQHIYELAYFDYLTGLPNRRFLIEELDHILARNARHHQFSALLFIDLDNFKLLNDTLGHDVGDMLLRQVAGRLRQALRESDLLSRLGGDEFVIVLENLGHTVAEAAPVAGQVARKILTLMDRPYTLAEHQCSSTPSIGIALFNGTPGGIEKVLKQADLAMYRAKADGRNTVRFFDASMQDAADHQVALESAMRDGLSEQQFVLFCQPQFDRDGRLVGGEMLLRWQHGEHGLVGPDEFIGLAESSGLIVPLGLHVLEVSCRALARWAHDPALGQLKLAVNVSVRQLRDPGFPQAVAAVLAATCAPADKLFLELTESVFAEDTMELIARMQQLRALGVNFSLDDFGTGYSSLAYLKRFPLAALKIDRSFIHDMQADPNSASIVEAIVALARKLKLEIVAEGVEHEMQRRFLIDCGCDALQGFLMGQPMPIEEFEYRYGPPHEHADRQPLS